VFESDAGEIDDAVLSSDPATPPVHIAVLAWIRQHGPADVIARRLSWIAIEPGDGAASVEAASGDAAFLDLPPAVVERLVAEDLILPIPPRERTWQRARAVGKENCVCLTRARPEGFEPPTRGFEGLGKRGDYRRICPA
jgi:hypothetical protein